MDSIDEYLYNDLGEGKPNAYTTIASSMDQKEPSGRFGFWLQGVLFLGVVIFAAMIVASIFYCNRRSQDKVQEKKQENRESQVKNLQDKLECKPWCSSSNAARGSSFGTDATERTATLDFGSDDFQGDSSTSEVSDSADASSSEDASSFVMEMSPPPAMPHPQSFHNKDGSVCAICNETYQNGQPVVISNNPHCLHQHHKHCMDKWLRFQNTCPVCNHHYVLHTV